MVFYKKYSIIFLIFVGSYNLTAQMINSRFTTTFYSWERYDTTNVSRLIVRGFQMVQLEVAEGNYSFHSNFYGAMNFNEFGSDGFIYLNNISLKVKNIANLVDFSLGRIPIFSGVGRGLIDGALIKVFPLQKKLFMSMYAGENVKPDLKSSSFKELKNNYLIGGQIHGEPFKEARIGLSYVNRNIKRESYNTTRLDTANMPVSVFVEPDVRAEQLLGIDARYYYNKLFTLYGKYDHDLNLKRGRTFQVNTRFDVLSNLTLMGGYSYRQPRIFYNSYFNIFPSHPFNEFEGGIEFKPYQTIMTYGKYTYIQTKNEASTRLDFGLSTEYINLGYIVYTGYTGDLFAIQAQFVYPIFDRKLIPSVGVTIDRYQYHDIAPEQKLYSVILGGTYRPKKEFSIDAQLQWGRNPIVSNELRVFGKINYWFSHNLGLF